MENQYVKRLYDRLVTVEREGYPMSRRERLTAVREPLLLWYYENRRVLPWREEPEPRLDLGDHASADKGGGCETVLCPFYGGSAGCEGIGAGGGGNSLKALGRTGIL